MATKPKSALGRKRAASVAPPITTDGCVITYFFNGRAFQRLFMESDIEGMKTVVRRKLDLPPSTPLSLAQLVDDQRVDLEDDADFSAFKFGTEIKPEMYVEVSVSSQPVAQLASPSITSPSLNLDQAPAEPVASSSKQPAKPKRTKKAATAPDADDPPEKPVAAQAKPASKKAPASAAPVEVPIASASTQALPKPKKRARKNAAEDEANTTTATAPPVADNPVLVDNPPADPAPPKKKRKSKAEVAISLPPPGPSQRKSISAEKPVSTTAPAAGSNADIMQRWAAESGKPTPPAAAEPKKKKKKGKEIPPPPDDSEPTECDICTKSHSGPPLSCPLLERHDANTVAFIEKRVDDLVANQGPDRAGLFTISALRRWLKEREKEEEAPTVSAPVPKTKKAKAKKRDSGLIIQSSQQSANPPRAPTPVEPPRPVIPKKSKPSEVAVSRQEEGISTDDEDIVKSVIQPSADSDTDTEGDDAPGGEAPTPTTEHKVAPPRAPSPATSAASSVAPAQPVPQILAPSKPTALASQRLTRPNVLALLDDLENEEANGEQDEDDGGSELAESTPSDVARKRHRKSVRMEKDDSDAGEDEDGDVEMGEVEGTQEAEGEKEADKPELSLSQILKSSQSLGGDEDGLQQVPGLDKGKERARQDDDIEEYESDKAPEVEVVIPGSQSSPIESAESPDAESNEKQPEDDDDDDDDDEGQETPTPQRPKSKPAKNEVVDEGREEEAAPEAQDKPAEESTPAPKKRGRPPLSQAVKDERAAERARIQAEKAASVPKKRGRPSLSKAVDEDQPTEETKPKKARASTNGNTSAMSAEVAAQKSRAVSSSQATPSQAKSDVERPETVTPPKKRGRPPLSEAVKAEREAERERARAEKAIKKMEAKTARANAKKGNGSEGAEQPEEEIEEAETTVGGEVDTTAHEESHPEWAVMDNPASSSARDNSSQVDEIEHDPLGTQKSVRTRSMQKSKSIARSMLPKHVPEEDDAEYQSTSKNLARPLFNPSSGLVKIGSHPGPQPDSSPVIPIKTTGRFSLSQPTPIRRRASALPRFTEIQARHKQLRQERRASQLATPSQLNSGSQRSQTGQDQEVLVIDESSSDDISSGDEPNQTVTPSQKKRKSVLAYFSQE
ncbi:FKBP-type peptidyl-prolyl cis-trans isomerase [Ceratobasidium sp. AG-Ba]|nr:FKBP-type peptidyl-prolyl cis-trans isomerase [Ceratobasidium sp. AG-Ba]